MIKSDTKESKTGLFNKEWAHFVEITELSTNDLTEGARRSSEGIMTMCKWYRKAPTLIEFRAVIEVGHCDRLVTFFENLTTIEAEKWQGLTIAQILKSSELNLILSGIDEETQSVTEVRIRSALNII